jgi:anti-sigma B factor antagonist
VPDDGSETLPAGRAEALTIQDQWDGGIVTITVRGEIDVSTAGALSQCLGEAARRKPQRLVIDLAEVGFMDSAALSAFVRVRKALPAECPVVFRSAGRGARQVFELTGLGSVFTFE